MIHSTVLDTFSDRSGSTATGYNLCATRQLQHQNCVIFLHSCKCVLTTNIVGGSSKNDHAGWQAGALPICLGADARPPLWCAGGAGIAKLLSGFGERGGRLLLVFSSACVGGILCGGLLYMSWSYGIGAWLWEASGDVGPETNTRGCY